MIGSPEIPQKKLGEDVRITETLSHQAEHRDDKSLPQTIQTQVSKLLKELNNPITFHILDDLRAHSQNISSNEEFKLSNLLGWIDALHSQLGAPDLHLVALRPLFSHIFDMERIILQEFEESEAQQVKDFYVHLEKLHQDIIWRWKQALLEGNTERVQSIRNTLDILVINHLLPRYEIVEDPKSRFSLTKADLIQTVGQNTVYKLVIAIKDDPDRELVSELVIRQFAGDGKLRGMVKVNDGIRGNERAPAWMIILDFIEDAELRFELMNIWISEEYGKKRTAVRDLLRTYNREDVWQAFSKKEREIKEAKRAINSIASSSSERRNGSDNTKDQHAVHSRENIELVAKIAEIDLTNEIEHAPIAMVQMPDSQDDTEKITALLESMGYAVVFIPNPEGGISPGLAVGSIEIARRNLYSLLPSKLLEIYTRHPQKLDPVRIAKSFLNQYRVLKDGEQREVAKVELEYLYGFLEKFLMGVIKLWEKKHQIDDSRIRVLLRNFDGMKPLIEELYEREIIFPTHEAVLKEIVRAAWKEKLPSE